MLNGWLENIKSIGVFLICAQMLIHFRPSGAYVKYLRLLVSIMILVQFVYKNLMLIIFHIHVI